MEEGGAMRARFILVVWAIATLTLSGYDLLYSLFGNSNAPAAPGAPTLTVVSKTKLDVSWDAVTGASSYNVYRGTQSGVTTATRMSTSLPSPSAACLPWTRGAGVFGNSSPGRNELRESGDEVRGLPEGGALLEAGVVVGVVEDVAAGPVIAERPQRRGSPSSVLSKGLSGCVIATIKAHGVVHGETRMSPAQMGLGKLRRDEAQLQEETGNAPSQALGEAGGIMYGEVGELSGGVESALKDEGVEVRVEPGRVFEGLMEGPRRHRGPGGGLHNGLEGTRLRPPAGSGIVGA
jgi:hypothetical protein